jgi:hypothetical protein
VFSCRMKATTSTDGCAANRPGPSAGIVSRTRANRSPTLLPAQVRTKSRPTSAGPNSVPPSVSEWQRAHSSRYVASPRFACSFGAL